LADKNDVSITGSRDEYDLNGLWYPVSFRYLLKHLGWRDRRFQGLLLVWALFTAACIESGFIADASQWVNFPLPFLGPSVFITLYPPVYLCQLALFFLGFEWAAIPSFLATFLVCRHTGMPVTWSALIGMGDPVGLAVFALIYRSAPLRVDLRSWSSVGGFLMATLAAASAAGTGAFVWAAANRLDAASTFLAWKGWLLGCTVGVVFIVMPVLRLTIPRWQSFLARLFPVEPRKESSFLFFTTVIGAAGLVMAGFLTETSYMASIRLMEALRKGVPPEVALAIRNAVASWQGSAWSAIAMVIAMMLVGLAHAYWWSARWRKQHEELAEANRHAEAALEVKSQFLATISHELRTPLNGILGMDQLLLDTDLTEEQRDYLNLAEESGYTLLELVNNLLDFSKMETTRQLDLASEPFDLRDLIEYVVRLLGPKVNRSAVALTAEIDDRVPRIIEGDENRFRQILLNLAGNAVKFTHKGRVRIEVCITRGASQQHLQVHVHDTGIGIAPKVLPTLFQPFTQADSSNTRRFGGTGLGLSISQRIAEAMGGLITVYSVLGLGSTFTLTVPLREGPVQDGLPAGDDALLAAGRCG
jgi:signal transduction histidine kinase